jgi:hypothetical protein
MAPASPPEAAFQDARLDRLPLEFVPNQGQIDGSVAYYVEGRDMSVYFAADGLTFTLAGRPVRKAGVQASSGWSVKLDFVGAAKGVVPAGLETSGTRISFFKGTPDRWRTGLCARSKIVYRDLWPGIDLVYSGTLNRMKYEFIVRPGADASQIALAYRGAESVSLTPDGRLVVRTPAGGFEDDAPVAWQEEGGDRRPVTVAYDLEAATYRFALGPYDRGLTLVIDPSSLIYCGFVGGLGSESAGGIAVDGVGSAFVAGSTTSTERTFPVNAGPGLATYSGSEDAFIAKVSPDGTRLLYCAYIGGAGADQARAVAVDPVGNAYIAGFTDSDQTTFPVAAGPDLTYNGARDAFVAKLDPSGTGLVYCGYIGGAAADQAAGLAIDAAGAAYVCGTTSSGEASFPVKTGPGLTFGGVLDVFVAKVEPAGTSLAYCGYIGGLYQDSGRAIAVDALGGAYVTGTTMSSENDGFPVTVGPDLTYYGDPWANDAFVAKVSPSGAALDYCGYLGEGYIARPSDMTGTGIAVDGSGHAYVVGDFTSPEWSGEVFVVKVGSAGTGVESSRLISGLEDDRAGGVALDPAGNVYVSGTTISYPPTFPVTVGPGLSRHGLSDRPDVFVAKLNSSLSGFAYSGYIGGDSSDYGTGIAVDASGAAYVTGTTTDGEWSNFPPIAGPDLTWNGGDSDAFVAKVRPVPAVSHPSLTSVSPATVLANTPHLTVTLEGSDLVQGAVAFWNGSPRATTFVSDTVVTADALPIDLRQGMTIAIHIHNPDGEGAGPVLLQVDNPVPVLSSFSPPSGAAGVSSSFRLLGSDFVDSSIVRWNGEVLSTTYTQPEAIDATLPAAAAASGGEFQVYVENPAPEGGASAALTYRIGTFTLSAPTPSATVAAGGQAAYTIRLTPHFGSYDAPVFFAKRDLPKGCAASFSSATVTPGPDVVDVDLTVKTTASSGSAAALSSVSPGPFGLPPAALFFVVLATAVLFRPGLRRSLAASKQRAWMAVALVLLIVAASSCGAGGGGGNGDETGTPPGTYEITVSAAAGTFSASVPVTLVVR